MARFSGYHSLELGKGFLTARATVSPTTDLAPASSNARAHASSVAPVVNTSSNSKTRRLSTWLPGRVAKAPRTDSQCSSKVRICLSGRARVRISSTALCGNPSRFASGFESSAAWLYPRSRSAAGATAPGRPRPPPARRHAPSQAPPAAPRTTLPAARSAHISAAGSPEPARLRKPQSFAPVRTRTSCPGKPGTAAPAPRYAQVPVPASAPPKASRKSHKPAVAPEQMTPGTFRKSARGSRSSAIPRRCGIPPEKTRSPGHR
jgi:hypothetical protein